MLRTAYVGFGANVGEMLATYSLAKEILVREIGPIEAESRIYESAALTLDGAESQSNYVNTVLSFKTELSPQDLLAILLRTELTFGRDRQTSERWTPRPIDLDLLFVEDIILSQPGLTLPHSEIFKRDFVLGPMVDIAPNFSHPCLNLTMSELEKTLEARGYERFVTRIYSEAT